MIYTLDDNGNNNNLQSKNLCCNLGIFSLTTTFIHAIQAEEEQGKKIKTSVENKIIYNYIYNF